MLSLEIWATFSTVAPSGSEVITAARVCLSIYAVGTAVPSIRMVENSLKLSPRTSSLPYFRLADWMDTVSMPMRSSRASML